MPDPVVAGPFRELPLEGRRLALGVTGGVAAYKAAELASALRQAGAAVETLMTEAATRFVAPLTFHALTGVEPLVEIGRAHV